MKTRMLFIHGKQLPIQYDLVEEDAYLKLTVSSIDDVKETVWKSETFILSLQKVKRIHVSGIPFSYEKIMNGCGYYRIGKDYKKLIEPYRNMLSASAFEESGFIINQSLTSCIPFGYFDSKEKGCGWIAAFNLLRYCNSSEDMQDIIRKLEENSLFGKVAGQSVYQLYSYLHSKLPVHMTLPYRNEVLKRSREAECGILLYTHSKGSHYVFFHRVNDSTFHFYNGVYGRRQHLASMEEYLDRYSILPFTRLIYMKK